MVVKTGGKGYGRKAKRKCLFLSSGTKSGILYKSFDSSCLIQKKAAGIFIGRIAKDL